MYLFALEAYSSPIPTASAMGLIERRRRLAVGGWRLEVGGWSMVAKGRRRRGTWADRQTGGMSLSLQTRTAGAVCASDLSKNKKQRMKSHGAASRPLSLSFAKLGAVFID